jgi:hypothetical protein
MNTFTTLHTNGQGYWSAVQTAVDITKLDLQYINDEKDFGELCVHFTRDSWDVDSMGLIYTDPMFKAQLRVYLMTLGFSESEAMDVEYSEQGMQGDTYVSCDVGGLFIAGLERMDPAHVAAVYTECEGI